MVVGMSLYSQIREAYISGESTGCIQADGKEIL